MSLAQIRPVVERFISDDRNDLLVIKGGWGVGKTYFWQDVIRGARAEGSVGRAHYSYVSLRRQHPRRA
jgi:tRNA A37 threonylcarbamoyladenosine biosynthesis protein TsaE